MPGHIASRSSDCRANRRDRFRFTIFRTRTATACPKRGRPFVKEPKQRSPAHPKPRPLTPMATTHVSTGRLRVHCFAVSLDGFGAGPNQNLENPLGVGGEGLHEWFFPTRTFKQMVGEEGGT